MGNTPSTPDMPGRNEALLPGVKAKPGLAILCSGERAASQPATTSPTALTRSDEGQGQAGTNDQHKGGCGSKAKRVSHVLRKPEGYRARAGSHMQGHSDWQRHAPSRTRNFPGERGLVAAKLPHAHPLAGGSSTVATLTQKLDPENVADLGVQWAESLGVSEPLKLPRPFARILSACCQSSHEDSYDGEHSLHSRHTRTDRGTAPKCEGKAKAHNSQLRRPRCLSLQPHPQLR